MLDRFVTSPSPPHLEVGEGRGGYDSREVGHDKAVPKGSYQDLAYSNYRFFSIRMPASRCVDLTPASAFSIRGECKVGGLLQKHCLRCSTYHVRPHCSLTLASLPQDTLEVLKLVLF